MTRMSWIGYSRWVIAFLITLVFLTTSTVNTLKDYRQAIPLAIVQADSLAAAKHPSNIDKINSTCNSTSPNLHCNQTGQSSSDNTSNNSETALYQNPVNFYDASIAANEQSQAVWHIHDATTESSIPSNFSQCKQEALENGADFDLEEFSRCNHSQEILVGPLKTIPEHPNGNGPQDVKLKETGGYRRTTDDKASSSYTLNRTKRELTVDEDSGMVTVTANGRSRVPTPNFPTKGVTRDIRRNRIGMPYIPIRSQFGYETRARIPFQDSDIMNEEISQIPSSEPIGLAGQQSFEPTNYEPLEEAEQSMLFPGAEAQSPGPDPVDLQRTYERSSEWEPVDKNRFSMDQEYSLGLPDRDYDRSLENEAGMMDNQLVNSFLGKRTYNDDRPVSALDSLGIGESNIDKKFMKEARNIQSYLSRYQELPTRNLGHDSGQHNNIQVDTSPELLRENPGLWNMMDSSSYTPYSQEAGNLVSNYQPEDGQILQSQSSMGRVFVPLNLDSLSQTVQNTMAKHYAMPRPTLSNGMVDSDKALPNYPNILKSFYPNVPFQTVSGASVQPPNLPGYRSFIQQGYSNQGFPQRSTQFPYQPVPMVMPFAGFVTNSNTQVQYAVGNPPEMLPQGSIMPLQPVMSGGGHAAETGHEELSDESSKKSKAKEPGMLTVSSSDDIVEDRNAPEKTESEFEELVPNGDHKTVLRVNVQTRPRNDSMKYLREQVANDAISMKTAIREVLDSAVLAGNISSDQSQAISEQLADAVNAREKMANNTSPKAASSFEKLGDKLKSLRNNVVQAKNECADTISGCKRFKDAGICPFVSAFMNGACAQTCNTCASRAKARVETSSDTPQQSSLNANDVNGPVMYLDFDHVTSSNVVVDKSNHGNNAVLLRGARLSGRKLGTCGKGAELNGGDISWEGKNFAEKPVDAVTLAMWVKVRRGGIINWFASGEKGTTFYTSAKQAIIPSKVWTHVAGTYDSATGTSSIYINGNLMKQTKQKKGQKLVQDWLVNGVGQSFGDDSMHYADEIYIFNRALKEAEIKAIYDKCAFNRMVIHYGFQKGNNTLILDQSGLQNDAIPIGGAVQKENCDRCGSCLDQTHGLNPTLKIERISLTHIPKRAVSISVWVSMNSTKGVHDVFITQGPLDDSGYRLRIIDGKVRWAIGTDNGETIFDYETKTVVVPEALWTHIIATYDKDTGSVMIFVNGVLKLTETVELGQRKLLPKDWETEAKLGGKSFNGYMDEFIMYNWGVDAGEASYVLQYCADHPKLVRFTVRVPLTKRNWIGGKYMNLLKKSAMKLGKRLNSL